MSFTPVIIITIAIIVKQRISLAQQMKHTTDSRRHLETPSCCWAFGKWTAEHLFMLPATSLFPLPLNNCPCTQTLDNYLIKLLIAAENWRKWLCKYFLSTGFIRVTCWRVLQTRDTDPVPGKSSKDFFFWSGFLAIWGSLFCLVAFFWGPGSAIHTVPDFFNCITQVNKCRDSHKKGVLVYLRSNAETDFFQIESKFCFIWTSFSGRTRWRSDFFVRSVRMR